MLRIGAVSYLNSKPLIFCLEELIRETPSIDAEIIVDLPSRLARGLAAGSLDVALIPCIEYARNKGYTIVSDACISCNGPVRSVMLYGRVPVEEIKTLSLDEGSRTSAALVRILLAERFGIHPQTVQLPIGSSAADSDADAVMLIGDRGMIPIDGPYEFVWDLGQEWCEWTGRPFVFAMWVARGRDTDNCHLDGEQDNKKEKQEKLATLDRILRIARDRGIERFEAIARREAPLVGLPYQQCYTYLRDNLTFHLGRPQRLGLEKFFELAARYNLAPPGVELAFVNKDPA